MQIRVNLLPNNNGKVRVHLNVVSTKSGSYLDQLPSELCNNQGREQAVTIDDIPNEIKEEVDFIFDAVPPFSNDASTIVDLTTSPFKICRQGSSLVELWRSLLSIIKTIFVKFSAPIISADSQTEPSCNSPSLNNT